MEGSTIKVALPLCFISSIDQFAGYYQDVCQGAKVWLFDIKIEKFGDPKTGDLTTGKIDGKSKQKVLELKKPSKNVQKQLSSRAPKATSSNAAPETVSLGPNSDSSAGSSRDEGEDGTEGDAHILEGANCLIEEAELSGLNVDQTMDCQVDDSDPGMVGEDVLANMFRAAEEAMRSEDCRFEEDEDQDDQSQSVSVEVKPIEHALDQMEITKLKTALGNNRHLVSEETEKAATSIQHEQNIIPEEAVIEAAMNDVQVAGNTVYSREEVESSDAEQGSLDGRRCGG
jgi:hypothetical protein